MYVSCSLKKKKKLKLKKKITIFLIQSQKTTVPWHAHWCDNVSCVWTRISIKGTFYGPFPCPSQGGFKSHART